jgi:predicted nucleotidyltransferase
MVGKDQQILTSIIKKHLPSVKIYLFGSRARGDYKSTSDIDIALDAGKKIDLYTLSLIKEEIEESSIPFTVDVVDLYTASGDFKKNILKDGKLWT